MGSLMTKPLSTIQRVGHQSLTINQEEVLKSILSHMKRHEEQSQTISPKQKQIG